MAWIITVFGEWLDLNGADDIDGVCYKQKGRQRYGGEHSEANVTALLPCSN